jgi:hypothetical protein
MPLGSQRFVTLPKRMAFAVKASHSAAPVTRPSAPSKPSSVAPNTFGRTAPHQAPQTMRTLTTPSPPNAATSLPSTSPVHSGWRPRNSFPPLASTPKISPPEAYVPEKLQPCSAPTLIVTSPSSSADGNPTRCSNIYTFKQPPLWPTTHSKCSNTVTTHITTRTISPILTPSSSENLLINKNPPTTQYLNKLGKNGPYRGEPRSICDSICDWARPARMCADRTLVNSVPVHSHPSTSIGVRFEEGATDVAACGNVWGGECIAYGEENV